MQRSMSFSWVEIPPHATCLPGHALPTFTSCPLSSQPQLPTHNRRHGAPPEILRWLVDRVHGEGAAQRKAMARVGGSRLCPALLMVLPALQACGRRHGAAGLLHRNGMPSNSSLTPVPMQLLESLGMHREAAALAPLIQQSAAQQAASQGGGMLSSLRGALQGGFGGA